MIKRHRQRQTHPKHTLSDFYCFTLSGHLREWIGQFCHGTVLGEQVLAGKPIKIVGALAPMGKKA
jgi:hypothetical protein